MNKIKTQKSFSYRDLLYKVLIFIGTVAIIVYFLPRDGKLIISSILISRGNMDSLWLHSIFLSIRTMQS